MLPCMREINPACISFIFGTVRFICFEYVLRKSRKKCDCLYLVSFQPVILSNKESLPWDSFFPLYLQHLFHLTFKQQSILKPFLLFWRETQNYNNPTTRSMHSLIIVFFFISQSPKTGIHNVAQADLKYITFLLQPFQY